MAIFEIIMLICFGAAWPISVIKSYRSRTNNGKSLWFLIIIFIGYIAGILFKLFYQYDHVIFLYIFNSSMIFIDMLLYIRNEYFIYTLSKTEEKLHKQHFSTLPRSVFCGLLKLAQYKTLLPNTYLIKQNTLIDEIYYILEGEVNIIKSGVFIKKLFKNSFIGEMNFLTGNLTNADVIAVSPVKYLVWKKKDLKSQKEILNYYTMYIALDLVRKINSTEKLGTVSDL